MCIICIEFEKSRDATDLRRMVDAAQREPNNIDKDHLAELEAHAAWLEFLENGNYGEIYI